MMIAHTCESSRRRRENQECMLIAGYGYIAGVRLVWET